MLALNPDGTALIVARKKGEFSSKKATWSTRANLLELRLNKGFMGHLGMQVTSTSNSVNIGSRKKDTGVHRLNVTGFSPRKFTCRGVKDPSDRDVFFKYSDVPTTDYPPVYAWSDNGGH